MMKIALAQMHVVPMDLENNISRIQQHIQQAKQHNADIVVFPELCVSGYLLSDQWLDRQFCRDLIALNEEIISASAGITVVYGNVCEAQYDTGFHPNKDGRSRLYNAAYVVQNQQLVKRATNTLGILPEGVQPKTLLPNYRFFDDERYFFSLQDVAKDFNVPLSTLAQPFLIETQQGLAKVGVQVCEDLWCKDYRSQQNSVNMSKHLIANGAQALLNISASPWTFHKNDARDRRIQFIKQEVESSNLAFVPFYYCNNVGAQNNGKNIITFDGNSSVYNNAAELVAMSENSFKEELLITESQQLQEHTIARPESNRIAQKYQAIITGLRHLPELLGWQNAPDFVVGLSGGVDSALVTALLTLAFGKDKVCTVNMPSRYNSDKTKSVAATISKNLGIQHLVVPIENIVTANREVFDELDNQLDSPEWMRKLSDENIQAKVRGTSILSNIAGRYGKMFTNNGNKVEIALGYATLYGDVGGVIAPIGDLTKAEVFEMVRYLNANIFNAEVIPETLVPDDLFRFGADDIAPSAELREAQIDPMKFGYHCKLLEAATSFQKVSPTEVMKWYLEGELAEKLDMDPALITRWGLQDPKAFVEDLQWFYEGIRKSVFKRIQSPPIILTSPSAYGFDIRESQLPQWHSTQFTTVKEQVLALSAYPGNT